MSAWLAAPYRLLIRSSQALALAAGFSIGLYLIIGFGFGLPLSPSTPALMQVHGQVQSLGFVALFIMAVGVQLFPRFHSSRLDRPAQVSLGGLLLAFGIVLRVVGQPLLLQPTRDGLLRIALPPWAVGSLGVPLAWLFLADAPAARVLTALWFSRSDCGGPREVVELVLPHDQSQTCLRAVRSG
jgi:hypothetical protein